MYLPKSFTTVTPLSKILALILFFTLPIIGFYLGMQYQEATAPVEQSPSTIQLTPTLTPHVITSQVPDDWKTYRNEEHGFEFRYPEKLKLAKEGNEIIIQHTIPYENYGDCDMIGDGKLSKNLTDFKVSFEIVPEKIDLDFVDGVYEKGNLNGSWVYEGAEGCGYYSYYFLLDDNKTLVIKKDAVQALFGISTMWPIEKILDVPESISKEEANRIFDQILSTFRFNTTDQLFTQHSEYRCATYSKFGGTPYEVCATCGNNICEQNEQCTSSSSITADCGGLYCQIDCE